MYVYEFMPVCIHVHMWVGVSTNLCEYVYVFMCGPVDDSASSSSSPPYVLSQGLSLGHRAGQLTLGMHILYFPGARTTAEPEHACSIFPGYGRSDLRSKH